MAAAYAALLSLSGVMEDALMYHARQFQPIFLYKQQQQVQYLCKKISSLLDQMEIFSNIIGRSEDEEAEKAQLESRIADAAYAAEDIIESHILRYTTSIQKKSGENDLGQPKRRRGGKKSNVPKFCAGLEKVIQDMDSIEKDVVQMILEKSKLDAEKIDLIPVAVGSFRSPPVDQKNTVVVGLHDKIHQIMERLTTQKRNLQVISITGMGGIGKTTLATKIYDNQLIAYHFHIHGWITVSQEYNVYAMLLGLLGQMNVPTDGQVDEHELGDKLYKHLSGRRYLIVLDDLWSIDAWYEMKRFLPDNNSGSRIIVTTRLESVANVFVACGSGVYKMNFLNEDESWRLLREKALLGHSGKRWSCRPELEEIGKRIAESCRGLPLSIIVIGALLAKSRMKKKYWEYVANNISSNLEENGHCLKVLSLSYNHLPVHLKPCFLYMASFPEDQKIRVSKLIKLWIGERFVKPNGTQKLEEVAEEYLKDLVDRNLVLVRDWGSRTGKIKSCSIHDLLRDLCLKEARRDRFLYVIKMQQGVETSIAKCLNRERRVVIDKSIWNYASWYSERKVSCALQSASSARSLVLGCTLDTQPSCPSRLLRVSDVIYNYSPEAIFQLVNSRYLAFGLPGSAPSLPSSLNLLWNLQTLVIEAGAILGRKLTPSVIWEMPQLRHLYLGGCCLPDPPPRGDHVLENLQTLKKGSGFRACEEILWRIPNIEKLNIAYSPEDNLLDGHGIDLQGLHKLEAFYCTFHRMENFSANFSFPQSLKKLSLSCCRLDQEDMRKIGFLEHLQALKLLGIDFDENGEWQPVEGQFTNLRSLTLQFCRLHNWTVESGFSFPRLEHLCLVYLKELKEIPPAIGDIPTLRLIHLYIPHRSIVKSAKKILKEQRNMGNMELSLQISYSYSNAS